MPWLRAPQRRDATHVRHRTLNTMAKTPSKKSAKAPKKAGGEKRKKKAKQTYSSVHKSNSRDASSATAQS